VASAHFVSIDKFHIDPHATGHTNEVSVSVDLILRMSETHAAGDVVCDRIFGVGGKL